MPHIKVHEKALAHLSRGLYRSPASALRELVSNAWDANATVVKLNTNFPTFVQVAVQDNGEGFTRDQFEQLMEGGIGNSDKREAASKASKLIAERPIIGKLGIGMLGIAQMCGAFTVTSRPKTGSPFSARVTLYDLLKERLDSGDPDVVKNLPGRMKEVDVGEYRFLDPPDIGPTGTVIIADDVVPTFVQAFQAATNFKEFEPPPLDWRRCVTIASKERSVHELGDYWRLLWDLSVATPAPYLTANAVPGRLIADEQKKLLAYRFKVFVDQRQIFKPINLSGNRDGYTTARIGPQNLNIYGKRLRFRGYVVVQEGHQIRPDELRGILVRIRNVAVGYYDPSFLDYRINQGPRSRWVTGEVFVDEGLEDALNVDRDSFNQFHPEFRAVQDAVHETLSKEIFPAVYRNILRRSKAKLQKAQLHESRKAKSVIGGVLGKTVRLASSPKESEEARVQVLETKRTIKLLLPNSPSLPSGKSDKSLASYLLAFFELATREHSKEKQRALFTRLLLEFIKTH